VKGVKNSIKLTILLAGVLLIGALTTIASAADFPYDYNYTNPADAGAFMGMAIVTCLIFALVWFIVWILVAIWVYRDAEKRGKSGVLWLIIVILLGLIGLIIWLVVRGEKSGSSRHCPNCGRGIPEDARICPYCNKKFDQP
jgi:hypothetical protein